MPEEQANPPYKTIPHLHDAAGKVLPDSRHRSANGADSDSSTTLYEQDFVTWAETTAQLLQQRKFSNIELESLIEEIQDLARRDRRQLQSRLSELLLHLLKWQYQPEFRSYPQTENSWNENSWARSIDKQRDGIRDLLKDSPSLKALISESLDECYTRARKGAARETRKSIEVFPTLCPYQESQILDDNFWPN
ncbi:hypothetical protein C1752_02066 [Acaryochloris thomasi RCC1774]|uniref:DUF29 domain-containing protein n=1 Tax=Acaryochloris thomasi RCC1774 TaxID=1764569 RepID=A0A2W1JQ94_9CYAN|nr:DUF29 domain-containing protein [Acaryochloris thomasi]PZD73585.1 hypothetical protein C1752_02066 [Acaryochloris thomasi RCC1774]